jgi:hypothetical protein
MAPAVYLSVPGAAPVMPAHQCPVPRLDHCLRRPNSDQHARAIGRIGHRAPHSAGLPSACTLEGGVLFRSGGASQFSSLLCRTRGRQCERSTRYSKSSFHFDFLPFSICASFLVVNFFLIVFCGSFFLCISDRDSLRPPRRSLTSTTSITCTLLAGRHSLAKYKCAM